jgi:two-component system, LytTR family, sensor kinase
MKTVRHSGTGTEVDLPWDSGSRESDEARPGPELSPSLGWRELLLIFGFWTAFGLVNAASLLISPLRQETSAPMELVGYTFLGAYTWAALTLPLFALTAYFQLERGRRGLRFAALGVFGLLVALLVTTFVSFVSSLFVVETRDGYFTGWTGMWHLARPRFPSDLLTSFVILSAGVARGYFFRHQARQEEANLLRAQLVESRLAVLRTQLNPHFLFNTLNALSALVATDPKGVRRMIARLSELLRYNLDGATEPEVSLDKELRIVQRYLEIVEIRYQGRLSTRISADPDVRDALVPNLILQPLVENAMKHGVSLAAGHGSIEVTARREEGDLVLSVLDTGGGSNPPRARAIPSSPGGLGLRHTRERLEQLYGDRGRLELISRPDGGMIAEIRLPYHTLPAIGPLRHLEPRQDPALG